MTTKKLIYFLLFNYFVLKLALTLVYVLFQLNYIQLKCTYKYFITQNCCPFQIANSALPIVLAETFYKRKNDFKYFFLKLYLRSLATILKMSLHHSYFLFYIRLKYSAYKSLKALAVFVMDWPGCCYIFQHPFTYHLTSAKLLFWCKFHQMFYILFHTTDFTIWRRQ